MCSFLSLDTFFLCQVAPVDCCAGPYLNFRHQYRPKNFWKQDAPWHNRLTRLADGVVITCNEIYLQKSARPNIRIRSQSSHPAEKTKQILLLAFRSCSSWKSHKNKLVWTIRRNNLLSNLLSKRYSSTLPSTRTDTATEFKIRSLIRCISDLTIKSRNTAWLAGLTYIRSGPGLYGSNGMPRSKETPICWATFLDGQDSADKVPLLASLKTV